MRLKDKVAIVTGGSRGIGFAIVEKYVQEGAKVAICGSRIETSQKALDSIKEQYPDADVMAVNAKMTSTEEIDAMFNEVVNKWGYVDILVNNAGVSSNQETETMTDEDFERIMDINVNGVFKCTRAAIRIMKERGGSIINTSSMVSINASPRQCAYSASKFAVNGLTQSFARELGKYNIRVNAVAPGAIATDMAKELMTEQMVQYMARVTALGRMGEPSEMAGAYVYLASDDSAYTTGTVIKADGGIVM